MSREIVGRERELETVERVLSAVPGGTCGVILAGEPGIGKSTVWQAALRLAEQRGYLVTSSRPAEPEARLSYAALGDLLGDAVEALGDALPEPQRRALDIALLRAEGPMRGADRRAVALATLGALKLLSSDKPLVLAVDDLQWLDVASASALSFALRRLGDAPVGVVAALRDAAGMRDPIDIEGALGTRAERVDVRAMGVESLARVVRVWTRAELPRPTLVRVHHAALGNPLFALEIVRALLREGEGLQAGEPLPVPDDLDALLLDRIRALPQGTRDTLLIAAATTRPTLHVLRAANSNPEADLLGPAEEAEVVRVRGDEVGFTHPLLASTVYRRASSASRRDAHRLLAEVVDDPEERARHLALAAPEPSADVAAALEDAALGANSRGAPAAAAELAELALRATPSGDVDASRRRAMKAAEYRFVAGDRGAALATAEELLEATPSGTARAEIRSLMSVFCWNDVTRLRPLLGAVLEEAEERSELFASTVSDLAWVEILGGDLRSASREARGAIRLAEQLGAPGPLSLALVTAAYAEFMLGRDVSASLSRALRLESGEEPLTYSIVSARNTLGAHLMWSGDLAGARSELERHARELEDRGQYLPMWEGLSYLSELESRAGNFQRALAHAEELLETMTEGGYDQAKEVGLWVRALAEAYLGQVDASRSDATEGLALAERHGDLFHVITNRSVLGFLELSLGDHEAAERWLRPLPDLLASRGIVEPGIYPFVPDLVEALTATGDLERAASALAPFERHAAELQRVPALAAAARCHALMWAAEGDFDAAIGSLTSSSELHAQVDQPFEAARTQLALGDVRRRAKQKRPARDALEAAVRAFDELGTPLWAAKARRSLARISGRSAPHDLTATERQVAGLVISGHTNREVAEALFMSVRTVESNLSRVYAKLGIASRRELRPEMLELDGSG
jgi:ATP/maltotriose-dependent transcriptional regulator MalT